MKTLKPTILAFAILALPVSADDTKTDPVKAVEAKTEAGPVKVDAKAPDFELKNQDGKLVKLSDYAGKNLVLVFSRAHW